MAAFQSTAVLLCTSCSPQSSARAAAAAVRLSTEYRRTVGAMHISVRTTVGLVGNASVRSIDLHALLADAASAVSGFPILLRVALIAAVWCGDSVVRRINRVIVLSHWTHC